MSAFSFPTGDAGKIDASNIPYTPANPSDYVPPLGPDATLADADDQLASRVKALESVPGAAAETYTCPMAATVRQLVYMTTTTNTVGIADASDPAKMRAVGFIATKPTATTCTIQKAGEISGFSSRTPGAPQYADPTTPGGITETRPDPLVNEVQEVGYAKSATVVVATIIGNPPIPV